MFVVGSFTLSLSDAPVAGITWSSPRASCIDTAVETKRDSTCATATSMESWKPVSLAALVNAGRNRDGIGQRFEASRPVAGSAGRCGTSKVALRSLRAPAATATEQAAAATPSRINSLVRIVGRGPYRRSADFCERPPDERPG